MSPAGNTLTPTYNVAEKKDQFVMPSEPLAEKPELTARVTPEDTKPREAEPTVAELSDMAKNQAMTGWNVTPDTRQNQPSLAVEQTHKAGIETNAELARQEIAVDAAAVNQVREAALGQTAEGENYGRSR